LVRDFFMCDFDVIVSEPFEPDSHPARLTALRNALPGLKLTSIRAEFFDTSMLSVGWLALGVPMPVSLSPNPTEKEHSMTTLDRRPSIHAAAGTAQNRPAYARRMARVAGLHLRCHDGTVMHRKSG
jgi:hypothetical protein